MKAHWSACGSARLPGAAPGMAPEKSGTLKTYAFAEDGVTVYSDE